MLLSHESTHKNLYLAGLAPDGQPRMHMNSGDLWSKMRTEQSRGGKGELCLADVLRSASDSYEGRPHGVYVLEHRGPDGALKGVDVGHNVITDVGANAMLQGGLTGAGRYLVFDTAVSAAQRSVLQATGVYTTIAVVPTSGGTALGGLPAFVTASAASTFQSNASNNGTKQNNANPNVVGTFPVGLDATYGTGIIDSFGTANAEGLAGSTTVNTASNINVTSYTGTKTHAINDWVVAMPSTADNMTSAPSGAQNSTILTPVPSGVGLGLRTSAFIYNFTTLTAALYTGFSLVTATAWGAGVLLARAAITPKSIGAGDSISLTYSIRT